MIDELYPTLHRFAAVVAPWDVEADDLLHDALVDVLAKRSLSEIDHLAAYLRRTIVNLAAGHSRRRGALRMALARMTSGHDENDQPSYPSEMTELEGLPPKERAVLYLAEVEGYRYAEIARMLGCSEVAARKRASRARERLRVRMALEESG
jgi:RNA polymerase sigma-70 factor (ECF subfamily)